MRVMPSAERRISHEARFLTCTPERSRFAAAAQDGRFTIMDERLQVLQQGKLPLAAGSIALHPGTELLAVASRSATAVVRTSGAVLWKREHRTWEDWEGGDVAFLGDGARLLAIRATDRGASAVLLRADTGEVLSERPIEVPEASGFHLVRPSLGDTFALWAGAGQDGQWTYWLRVSGTGITLAEERALNGREHSPVELLESGTELLVAVEYGVERYTYPGMRLLGRMEPPEDLGLDPWSTCFLGAGRALIEDKASARLYAVTLDGEWSADEVVVAGHEPRRMTLPQAPAELCGDLWYLRTLPRSAALCVHGRATEPQELVLLSGPPLFEAR